MRMHLLTGDVDIIVDMEPAIRPKRFTRVRESNKAPVSQARVLAFDSEKSNEALLAVENLSKQLKEADIEIDIEHAGKFIESTSMIAVRDNYEPVFAYKEFDILDLPTGESKERTHRRLESNVNEAIPVRVTDQYIAPRELVLRFIFRKSYFLSHQDSASYKILHDLAAKLQARGQFVRLQAHDQETKTAAPLVLVSGTVGFGAAFLEGKVDGSRYCLVLHLSDRELRLPGGVE